MCMQKREQEDTFHVEKRTELEVVESLYLSPGLFGRYQKLKGDWRQRFLDFYTGKKTLPLTYDPFFKKIFHPDIHSDRLSHFLSSILGCKVRVVKVLPTEESLLDGALLIMDILVELEDGALANVEVQKIPYNFPGERMSCYSADLLLRQYNRVKGERGKDFKYNDIKKVYTIILFEKSTKAFHEIHDKFIHRGKTTFDTGLSLELLQEYCLVALDVFREIPYPKGKEESVPWIGLLATEDMDDVEQLIADYPWLEEIYREMAGYMNKPEEVLTMFSDALKILDENTVLYMIDEQAELIEKQCQELTEKVQQLDETNQQLEETSQQLKETNQQLKETNQQLEETSQQLEETNQQLDKKERQLNEQLKQNDLQKQLIEELQEKLRRLQSNE